MKTSQSDVESNDHDAHFKDVFRPNGHLAPLLGTLSKAMGLSLDQTLYVFLLNHAKTLLSAAIRASVIGPYQSHAILAGKHLRGTINDLVKEDLRALRPTEEAVQVVPMLDVWGGRHDIVYSRIFNS